MREPCNGANKFTFALIIFLHYMHLFDAISDIIYFIKKKDSMRERERGELVNKMQKEEKRFHFDKDKRISR